MRLNSKIYQHQNNYSLRKDSNNDYCIQINKCSPSIYNLAKDYFFLILIVGDRGKYHKTTIIVHPLRKMNYTCISLPMNIIIKYAKNFLHHIFRINHCIMFNFSLLVQEFPRHRFIIYYLYLDFHYQIKNFHLYYIRIHFYLN